MKTNNESILTNEEKEFIASLEAWEMACDIEDFDYELNGPYHSEEDVDYDRETSNRLMEEYRKTVVIELSENPFE